MKNKIIQGSRNVFADLGLANPERVKARAEIMHIVVELIKNRGLKQQQIARILKIPQSKVSCLMNGKLSLFSMDRLFEFLNALGRNVVIIAEPKVDEKRHASTQVFLKNVPLPMVYPSLAWRKLRKRPANSNILRVKSSRLTQNLLNNKYKTIKFSQNKASKKIFYAFNKEVQW